MYSGPVTKFSVNIVGEFYVNSCGVHIENKCILQCNVMFEIEIVTMLSFILAETFIIVICLYLFSKKRRNKIKKKYRQRKTKNII